MTHGTVIGNACVFILYANQESARIGLIGRVAGFTLSPVGHCSRRDVVDRFCLRRTRIRRAAMATRTVDNYPRVIHGCARKSTRISLSGQVTSFALSTID